MSSESNSEDGSLFESEDDLVNADPLATEEEQAEYARQFALEKKEEDEFDRRFSREVEVGSWCLCSSCVLEFVVKPSESRCCHEIDAIMEKLEESDVPLECITEHEGFKFNCLNRYVFDVAGVYIKNKSKKRYSTLRNQGRVSQNEYFRAVAYRNFVTFIWRLVGSGMRYPLPSCVYAAIRREFPDKEFHGFEEAEDDEDASGEDSS